MEYEGHVVVVPYPSQGHINPILQFAKRLASKGVKATIATTRYTVTSICAPNVGVEAISDGFDEGGFAQAGGAVDVFLESFRVNGSRTLAEIIERYKSSGFPINCVVYDSFLPWALDVAKRYEIYGASFFTNPATDNVIFARVHHGLLTLPVKKEDAPLVLPGMPPLDLNDLPSFVKSPESYPAYLHMKLLQYANLDQADWLLANSFEAIEGEVVKGTEELWPTKLIGPMVPSAYVDGRIEGDKGYGASLWKPHGDECLKWLDEKPRESVMYASFGSMASLTAEQMGEIAWGLKDTGFYFLWVVKESERGKLPDGFMESTKEKGLIVAWCDQLETLAHQATCCFITHCGWNSTLEALSLGVPMVGVPQWVDQLLDAKFIEDVWGVGVRAKEDEKGIVRREALVSSIKDVMEEGKKSEEIKKNASKWKALTKEAISEGGSSDKCIDELVRHLKGINKK